MVLVTGTTLFDIPRHFVRNGTSNQFEDTHLVE